MMKPEHWVSPRSLRCNGGNNGVRRTRRFRAATQRRERARLGNRRSKWTWKCPPRSSLWRARRGSIPMTNQPERGGRGRNVGPGRRRRRSFRRACDVTGPDEPDDLAEAAPEEAAPEGAASRPPLSAAWLTKGAWKRQPGTQRPRRKRRTPPET